MSKNIIVNNCYFSFLKFLLCITVFFFNISFSVILSFLLSLLQILSLLEIIFLLLYISSFSFLFSRMSTLILRDGDGSRKWVEFVAQTVNYVYATDQFPEWTFLTKSKQK